MHNWIRPESNYFINAKEVQCVIETAFTEQACSSKETSLRDKLSWDTD